MVGVVGHVCVCVWCLLYTYDAADDTPCVDLCGRRIIKKKKKKQIEHIHYMSQMCSQIYIDIKP